MKKIISFLVLMIFALSACSSNKNDSVELAGKLSADTFTLKKEVFSKTLELTGTLEAARQTPIAAKIGGRVVNINYEVGDIVNAGDLIASLAGDESAIGYETSSLNESNVRSSQTSQKIFLDEQVKNAENVLGIAEENLHALETSQSDTSLTTAEQIIFAEKSVEQAKIALENAKSMANQRLESLYSSAPSAILSSLIITESANSFSDTILGLSDEKKNMNQDMKKYLAAFDPNSKIKATNSLRISLNSWDDLKSVYDEKIKDKSPSYEEMDEYLNLALDLLEKSKLMLSDVYSVLDSTTTGADFTEQQLQALKMENITMGQNIVKTLLSTSGNFKVGVKGIIMNIDESITQNQIEISTAEQSLLKAEQGIIQAKAGASQNISSIQSQKLIAEKQIEQAKGALESVKAQRDTALSDLQTQLDLVRGNKRLSAMALENTQIYAPFGGVITSKFVEVGQVIAPGQSVIEIADDSFYKVKSDIPDVRIKDVNIGATALVSIDGINGQYEAVVTKINPRVDSVTRKLAIEITLTEKPENAKVGMFTNIAIDLPVEESFFISRDFINSSFEGPFVKLQNGEKIFVNKSVENSEGVKIWFEGISEGMVIVK